MSAAHPGQAVPPQTASPPTATVAPRTATGYPLPNRLPPEVAPRREELLLSAPFDLDADGRPVQGWVLATREQLWVLQDGLVVRTLPLAETRAFRATSQVGQGLFEATVAGEPQLLARYTLGHAPYFAALERYLNELAEGRTPVHIRPVSERRCPRCGQRLPEGTSVCPRCVDKWAALRRLATVVRPHAGLLGAGILLFWGLTGLRLVTPQLYRLLIDGVLRAGRQEVSLLVLYVGLIGLVGLLTQVLSVVRGRVMVALSGRLSRDLRAMVFAKLQALSLAYITRYKPGELMNRVTGDTGTLQRFVEQHAAMAVTESLVFVGVVLILFTADWRLALLVLLPAPLVLLYTLRVWETIHRLYRRQWRAWDRTNSLLQDVLSGIRVVKAFGQEQREAARFTRLSAQLRDITAHNEKTWNTLFPSLGFVLSLGQFLVLYYGGHLILRRQMEIGELVQFSAYASMIYEPLRFASFIPRWFGEAMTAVERVFEILDEEPDVKEASRPVRRRIEGAVTLRHVRFGYESHRPVLQDINLEVRPGEKIGLVGHSGAGKSTLINLLCRFYDPDEGEILIDGIDIREYARDSLHAQIGVVLQETFLFSGTILENITYARPEASMDEVIRAAKAANAHDFIVRFPDGYDTRVGERGQRLSGGERQRIAIARALLHDPRILILDEATSSVDSETEMQIQQAMSRLLVNRTAFVIAHRLATLRIVDRILVLDQGRQVELGTHEELIRQRGLYYKLVMAQLQLSRTRGVEG